MKTRMRLVRGDITTIEADAIVNSSNNDLVLGGGVSGTISRVAGMEVQEECHKVGTVPLGTAVATGAGMLKAKWIIHAAVNPLGLWADAKSVRKATKNVLAIADEKQIQTLAFPALGTGAGALSVERCADILIDEVARHCSPDTTPLEEVMFVIYDEKTFTIFEERFNEKTAPKNEIKPEPAAAEPTPAASAEAPSAEAPPAPSPAVPPEPPTAPPPANSESQESG